MIETAYAVPDMSCGHCTMVVNSGFGRVIGVRGVDVDLGTKRIVVRGEDLDDASLKAAIVEAGYEAA